MDYGYKPTTNGLELLAACMAHEAPLKLTRVAIGDGVVPDGTNLSDVHELVSYVVDGMIGDRQHEDNRLYLTIQYENKSHPEQPVFMMSEFIVYAEHPVTGEETDLLYATLGDYRQPIPPYSDAQPPSIWKYPLILVVSDDVNVIVDASAGMVTYDQLEDAVSSAVNDLAKTLPGFGKISFVIPESSWQESGDTDYPYYAEIIDSKISEKHYVSIMLDRPSLPIAQNAGISTYAESGNGKIKLFALYSATNPISGTCLLFSTGASGGEGGGGYYELPIATEETLGGVKIGDGISVDGDGTISSDGEVSPEHIATDEEAGEMIKDVFKEEL